MIKNLKLLGLSLLMTTGLLFVAAPSATVYAAADPFELFSDSCKTVGDSEVCGPCKDGSDSAVCKDSKSGSNPIYGPGGIIATVVTILSIVIGVAAVIVIIIAGIQYMLSTGDPTKVNNAKNAILYAVIGLIIAGLSQVIVQFVVTKIG